MNRRMLGLAVFLPLVVAACGNANSGDANKTKATAETPSNAAPSSSPSTTAAPPTTAAEAPKGTAEHDKEAKEHGAKTDHDAAQGSDKSGEKMVHLTRAKMDFNGPGAGWTESKKGVWTLFHPADKSGVLAFVEFEKPNEAAARLGQIAEGLELSDIKWKGAAKKLKVGPEKLPAELSEGTCKMANKHEGEIEAYDVDGATLIVYAAEVDTKKAGKHEMIATKTVDTIRRTGGETTPAQHRR